MKVARSVLNGRWGLHSPHRPLSSIVRTVEGQPSKTLTLPLAIRSPHHLPIFSRQSDPSVNGQPTTVNRQQTTINNLSANW